MGKVKQYFCNCCGHQSPEIYAGQGRCESSELDELRVSETLLTEKQKLLSMSPKEINDFVNSIEDEDERDEYYEYVIDVEAPYWIKDICPICGSDDVYDMELGLWD